MTTLALTLQLVQLSSRLGLTLETGHEVQSLGTALQTAYPRGLHHLGLEEEHRTTLEAVRAGTTEELDRLVPALESLVARESRRPLATLPAVRLSAPVLKRNLLLPPQGGACVRTSEGQILIGVKPWVNKWMVQSYWGAGGDGIARDRVRHEIPTYHVFDEEFSGPAGLFPLDFIGYMGFPVKDTVFTIIAEDAAQAGRIVRYLDWSYLGDRSEGLNEKIRAEYPEDSWSVPDMMAEITLGFATPPPETLRTVPHLDEQRSYRIGGVTIRKTGSQIYHLEDRGVSLGTINLRHFPPRPPQRSLSSAARGRREGLLREVLKGRPGLWPFGTSDGWDPRGTTSGFMIWNGGRFLLIDPPSHTLEYLEEVGIPLDLIAGVLVTHGHSDHYGDAIPQLVRARPDLKLYTTPTIYEMLADQYALAIGRDDFRRWTFEPLRCQTPVSINGMEFRFDYTFHTVPTIGFEIGNGGNLVLYFSGDTYADADGLQKILDDAPEGTEIMSFFRALSVLRHGMFLYLGGLQDTPPVILMEGGIPPIHTPPASTRALLRAAREDGLDVSRFFLYHLSAKKARREKVPKLREGHEGWIDLSDYYL